jgi:cytochrome P450
VQVWSLTGVGSDTTATTLSAVFFYLVHNPECLKKVNAEIRSTFSDEESIKSGQQLNSCRYLRACINEALRCAPPITAILPRHVLPGGFTTGENHFPESTIVGTPIYAIHHNEAYFPDPFKFKPERWIVDPALGYTDDKMRLAQSAYSPFSLGPRSCAGKNLAIMELCITIARTLFLYDIRLDASHTHGISPGCSRVKGTSEAYEYRLKGWVTSGTNGPLVQFRPREL